jgi:HAD superfamily hydrolase (TIGR01490 family)
VGEKEYGAKMKRVAIFDFDNTLIEGDSFLPFLTYAAGIAPCYAALVEAGAAFVLLRARGKKTGSLRTFGKGFLLNRLLKGKRREDLAAAVSKTRAWQKINEPVMRTLREHREKGDMIVIASGSLDLYLPELVRDIPHDALICTDVGIENGIVTGEMIHGNCVRLKKAERIKAWLEANGPFEESFGYGNYPHDVPMLEVVKYRVIVS